MSDQTAGHSGLARWDFKGPARTFLSEQDIARIAYSISNYLHHCTGIPSCRDIGPTLCVMCGHAARLVVQDAEPRILEAAFRKMSRAIGYPNADPNPRSFGDD